MIVDHQIQTQKKSETSKVWYGNPQIELIEGIIIHSRFSYTINKNLEKEYDESELEFIKQHIWETNSSNSLINSDSLCCVNIPNKISINEFLSTIDIYLSYISVIRVLKSAIPNIYFIYLQMKNKEYANIFYNTFNYSKINPIEKEYLIFSEVKNIKFEEIYRKNELSYKNSKKLNGINILVSPSVKDKGTKKSKQFIENFEIELVEEKVNTDSHSNQHLINNDNIDQEENNNVLNSDEINVCSICLEHLANRKLEEDAQNYLTSVNGIINMLCGHCFHIECSLKLDDDKCPMCRYYLSPANISTCSLCNCENDLWMCLICGSINCGDEGGSNNHRKEHYSNMGHIYAKGLGTSHNVTYDFTRNAPLNLWIQNHLVINPTDQLKEDEILKDPKEKVEYIMSEYNSIISSQLESQRFFYIDLMKKIEDSYKNEDSRLEKEIILLSNELDDLNIQVEDSVNKKNYILDLVKQKETQLKTTEAELKETEKIYKELADRKVKFEGFEESLKGEYYLKSKELDKDIEDLINQINELKIHLKTLNKVESQKISGASIELLLDTQPKNKRGSRKNNKK